MNPRRLLLRASTVVAFVSILTCSGCAGFEGELGPVATAVSDGILNALGTLAEALALVLIL